MEVTRKLASVRRISEINPIPDADKIVCATIDGWKVVTQKSNNFNPGDLVVYFEVDSFLPVLPIFEFLRKCCFKSTKHLGDGFRIRTIKLKGQVSQGLILPISEVELALAHSSVIGSFTEGMDLTEFLGVQKYEKPIPTQLRGQVKGNFPTYIRKTDQERIQNIANKVLNEYDKEEVWEATLKLDGSSMTVYLYNDEFGVCSRNLDLKEDENNTFWKTARYFDIEERLRSIGRNLALQGELMGPGVQGNREQFEQHLFFLFDIWDIDEQRYLNPTERQELWTSHLLNIPHIYIIDNVKMKDFTSIDDFLNYADRASLTNFVAEGVVFKSSDGTKSFKVINNRFLLQEDD